MPVISKVVADARIQAYQESQTETDTKSCFIAAEDIKLLMSQMPKPIGIRLFLAFNTEGKVTVVARAEPKVRKRKPRKSLEATVAATKAPGDEDITVVCLDCPPICPVPIKP